jgi:hypothetical protein
MEKLKIAEQEHKQLARHNMLLEKALIARDRVSADFRNAKAAGGDSYGLDKPKVAARLPFRLHACLACELYCCSLGSVYTAAPQYNLGPASAA